MTATIDHLQHPSRLLTLCAQCLGVTWEKSRDSLVSSLTLPLLPWFLQRQPGASAGQPLATICGVPVGWDELRTYSTLLSVLRAVTVGYVIVSSSDKGGFGPVRASLIRAAFSSHECVDTVDYSVADFSSPQLGSSLGFAWPAGFHTPPGYL